MSLMSFTSSVSIALSASICRAVPRGHDDNLPIMTGTAVAHTALKRMIQEL
jgi:hypothetical protein